MQEQMGSSSTGSASYLTDSTLAAQAPLSPGAPSLTGTGAVTTQQPIPNYRLFDMTSIGIAAFLGSPIAATALMAINYRRLGRPRAAVIALASGIVGTAAAMLAATLFVSSSAVSSAAAAALFAVTYQTIKGIQGPVIAQHLNQGGSRSSRWAAFGISVATCVALLAVVFGGVLAYLVGAAAVHDRQSAVAIGTKDNILISGSATKQDALSLGQALKQAEYFKDNGATVLLDKTASGTAVSFVVHEGIWDRPEMVSAFEEIGREIAPSIGGLPIKLRLADSSKNIRKEVNVGKTVIGKDEVYYYGSATEADASALAQSLKANGYFGDRRLDVFLNKDNGRTVITFIVAQDSWDNPNTIAEFKALVRKTAPSVGGLPIQMQLDDDKLEIGDSETVN
jgi:hypothetical protein